ncbi:MAG: hypothetical protein WC770_07925 [Phycisphaerae bacterium]|jgi:hypothetical protein
MWTGVELIYNIWLIVLVYTVGIMAFLISRMLPRTYRQEKRSHLWVYILLPPFLVVPFALVPPLRNPTVLLAIWLPLFLFFLGSIILLFKRIIAILFKSPDKLIMIKLIRPALTILVFVCVFKYHIVSGNMADAYGIKLAKGIQAACDSNGICPESIPSWKIEERFGIKDPNCFATTVCKLMIPYHVTYNPIKDKKGFIVNVNHGFHDDFYIEGGVGKKLRAADSGEGGECERPIK